MMLVYIEIVIVAVTLCTAHVSPVGQQSVGFNVLKGEINRTYVRDIWKGEHHVYQFELDKVAANLSDPFNANVKVYAEVSGDYDDVTFNCPLLFTIRQRQDVKAWELPVFSEHPKSGRSLNYRSMARTLCFSFGDVLFENDMIIMISTCSEQYFQYLFKVEFTFDAFIPIEKPVSTQVSLYSPVFYRFKYPDEHSDAPVLVTADSEDDICMIVSIQRPECPVLDTESTVRYTGHWQTMSSKAGITVSREYFPKGFFIALVVLSDDSSCDEYQGIVPPTVRREYWDHVYQSKGSKTHRLRNKDVTLHVRKVMDDSDYILPIILPLSFYVALILIVFAIFVQFHRLQLQIPKNKDTGLKIDGGGGTERPEGCKQKLRATVFISDFVKADYKSLQKKSKQYFWSVTTVAVFYCAPVVQLISNYLKVLYRTGEQDLCYYNFLCANPYKNIMDFNHLYSNIGYVILGVTFMCFVRLRQRSLRNGPDLFNERVDRVLDDWKSSQSERSCWRSVFPSLQEKLDHGVLQHFGLFYAMGVALIMEGALSASYHLCPNQTNFQYDTSFMYVIAVLGIVKIYQFRHPVNVNANILIMILALVSLYTMFGLLFENLIFKMIFTLCYALMLFNILTYWYYVGYLKNQYDEVVTNWLDVYKYICTKWKEDLRRREKFFLWSGKSWTLETDSGIIQLKSGPNRLMLPVLCIVSNGVIIGMIWTVMVESNFATQVLAMLIVNLVTYTCYYAVMKGVHNEYEGRVWLQTLFYGILAVVLWVFSLNYFRQAATSWEKSPAESKAQNKPCFFMDFYDEHDMWHFLSAGAMFCSFMMLYFSKVLFTLDDDLIFTPQVRIPVF